MPDEPAHPNQRHATSFDTVADAYARYRPAYPTELIELLLARCAIQADARVLEIGCGTGKASAQLAGRGFQLVALDPGANLLAIAQRELANDRHIQFECSRFEDWPAPAAHFDLILSAQAFHWLDATVAYPKIARTLKPGGWLALLWHTDNWGDTPIRHALDQVYAGILQGAAPQSNMAQRAELSANALVASGLFAAPEIHVRHWTRLYTAEEYLGLLTTFSDHITLPTAQRDALFAAIRQQINARGGVIEKPYQSLLYLIRAV